MERAIGACIKVLSMISCWRPTANAERGVRMASLCGWVVAGQPRLRPSWVAA
jgi:hypothetical protein